MNDKQRRITRVLEHMRNEMYHEAIDPDAFTAIASTLWHEMKADGSWDDMIGRLSQSDAIFDRWTAMTCEGF